MDVQKQIEDRKLIKLRNIDKKLMDKEVAFKGIEEDKQKDF